MKYGDLQQLIRESSSTRRYFLSLPVEMQIELHSQNAYICTAEALHRRVGELEVQHKQIELSEYYRFH